MKPNFQLRDVEVYMDNAATTAIDEEVVATMRPYLEERYGNPETVYRLGRESRKAVEDSRATIADILKCTPEEIFFTSGGTEANNWAIKGIRLQGYGGIIVGAIEHASVLEPANSLFGKADKRALFEIPVDSFGLVDLNALETHLQMPQGKQWLVSIQYANNEIGTVQPVEKIAELCKKYGAVFHCDVVQAFGKIDFDVDDVGADMISLSAHKIHGPMGMGALYVKKGTLLEPLLHGGGQERGMRSGTLAVPEIVGFAKAAELAMAALPTQMPRLMRISEWLAEQLRLSSGGIRNGHTTQRLPNIVSITLPGIESEVVCGIMCSKYKSCLSAGSACSTTKRRSHVLEAIGRDSRDVLSTLRISLSRFNLDSDVMVAIGHIQTAIKQSKTRELI
jgi:cysteine desulfurase